MIDLILSKKYFLFFFVNEIHSNLVIILEKRKYLVFFVIQALLRSDYVFYTKKLNGFLNVIELEFKVLYILSPF